MARFFFVLAFFHDNSALLGHWSRLQSVGCLKISIKVIGMLVCLRPQIFLVSKHIETSQRIWREEPRATCPGSPAQKASEVSKE